MTYESAKDKQESFYKELKDLLVKYDAEMTLQDFPCKFGSEEKIVVEFKYDESLFDKEGTGVIPDLVLGRFENGIH